MRNLSLLFVGLIFTCVSCTAPLPEEPETVFGVADTLTESAEPVTEEPLEEQSEWSEKELTPEMLKAFLGFRSALLSGSCEELAKVCVFPIKGDCVADLLEPSETYDADRVVTEEAFLGNCSFLDDTETAVLKKRTSLQAKTDVNDGYCVYKDFFDVRENESEFTWSVGCIQLVKDEIGEYSRIFIFQKVNGVFKLVKIDCAG